MMSHPRYICAICKNVSISIPLLIWWSKTFIALFYNEGLCMNVLLILNYVCYIDVWCMYAYVLWTIIHWNYFVLYTEQMNEIRRTVSIVTFKIVCMKIFILPIFSMFWYIQVIKRCTGAFLQCITYLSFVLIVHWKTSTTHNTPPKWRLKCFSRFFVILQIVVLCKFSTQLVIQWPCLGIKSYEIAR